MRNSAEFGSGGQLIAIGCASPCHLASLRGLAGDNITIAAGFGYCARSLARSEITPERLPTVVWHVPSAACGGRKDGGRPQLCSCRVLTPVRRGSRAEHAGEAVAATEFGADDVAVRTQRLAQCGDLNLEVLFRYDDIRPHHADELILGD